MPSHRALRVGLVCPYSLESPGGVQSHVLGLTRHLLDQGHEAFVLAPGGRGGVVPPGISRAPGDLPPSWHPALDPGRFSSAGVAVPLRYNGSVARVNFGPRSAARVRRWLSAHRFDLVHVHEPVTPSIALLALWAAEQPVVATFHTATPRSRSMRLAGGVLRPATEKLYASIAVSETARLVVVQHLGRDAVVIPNGFRFADFGARPRPAAASDRRRLVFLGRADEPRKGLDVLLAALPAIRQAVPDLEVVIAGQRDRPLPPGCAGLGPVSEAEKIDLLASADVFVAPHRGRESFGIVVLEAMASGVPVVAADLDPFVDLLGPSAPGEPAAGTLFPTGDSQALARSVTEVLRRPDPARTALARQRAHRYDWSTVGAAVLAIYRAAVAASNPVPSGNGPITLRALLPPSGDLYARPASMRSIAARPMPAALSAQRAERTEETAVSDYPEDLKYTSEHEWVRSGNGSTVRVGITEYAADQLGDIVFASLPAVGESVSAGDACGELESTKSVSDIFTPVPGVISAVNALLDSNPETVNADPYGDGWLFELEMEEGADLEDLLDADAYAEQVGS